MIIFQKFLLGFAVIAIVIAAFYGLGRLVNRRNPIAGMGFVFEQCAVILGFALLCLATGSTLFLLLGW